jgi:hypothetical protein
MREVLRTSSLSQAESLAIALEAAGIPDPVSRLPSQRLLSAVLTVLLAILVTLCLQL